mgnify:FL=1
MPDFDALPARPVAADASAGVPRLRLTRAPRHQEAPIRLRRGETIGLWLPSAARIAVLSGRIWLTVSGDATDHFLAAGCEHRITLTGRSRLVVCEGDADGISVLSVGDARRS